MQIHREPKRTSTRTSTPRTSAMGTPLNGKRKPHRPDAPGGYSLPFVMGISAMLAFSSFAMVTAVASASKTSGDMLRRRKAFYACDGLSRVVTKLSQAYMATTSEPTSAGLDSYVTGQGGGSALPNLAPSGFEVTGFTVETVGDSQASVPLPSGPFRGMNARQDTIELKVEARHQELNYVCRTEQTVTLGKVALFQFYVFSDTDFDGHPGPQMTLEGRAHINGDACPAGQMRISRITASGALRHSANGNCAYQPANGLPTEIQRTDGSYSQITTANDHDTPNWEEDAIAEWGGNALDESHDVPELKPPTVGIPVAQMGANATDGVLESGGTMAASQDNTGSLRFLIDPVVSGEPQDVRDQKLAYLSDIRIIDGVWYKNLGTWPGTPIWSDHPGNFSMTNSSLSMGNPLAGSQVGQRTVAASQGWSAVPRRYSYYGTLSRPSDPNNQALLDPVRRNAYDPANSVPAVISYGSTNRATTTTFSAIYPTVNNTQPIWEPGGWVGEELCERTYTLAPPYTATSSSLVNGVGVLGGGTPWGGTNFAGQRSNVHACGSGSVGTISQGAILLNATRQGFRENHRGGPYFSEGIPDTGHRSQILPANFDLMAFQAAMADTSSGELGSHFSGGSDFNGIVWMTFTWPGSLAGMTGSTSASVVPMDAQGISNNTGPLANVGAVANGDRRTATDIGTVGVNIPAQFAAAGSQTVPPVRVNSPLGGAELQNNEAATQRELPFQLCSRDANVIRKPFFGAEHNPVGDMLVSRGNFFVQDCDDYTNAGGRVTAVRVMNGRDLDPEMFPRGLTISTNLPLFVLGDMNTVSVPQNNAVLPQPSGSRTWIPLLLAGDVMYHGSNAWADVTSPWSIRSEASQRQATETTYNISELIGWVPSSDGNGGTRFHNLQGFQERWGAVNHNINGSVAIGWRAVYHRNNRTSGGGFAYSPPIRNWTFDTNYRLFSNQPPGTPTFDVAATKKFSRDAIDD